MYYRNIKFNQGYEPEKFRKRLFEMGFNEHGIKITERNESTARLNKKATKPNTRTNSSKSSRDIIEEKKAGDQLSEKVTESLDH